MPQIPMMWRQAMPILVYLLALASTVSPLRGQQAVSGSIQGTVVDPRGQAVQGAAILVRNASQGTERKATTDGDGKFAVGRLTAGTYTVEIAATGFAPGTHRTVTVGPGTTPPINISLAVASVAEEVTVEADDTTTISTQLSPLKALLDAGSARTEINNTFIREFTSPMTDFTEVMQVAPGTFSVSPNGVGLGQSNTSFRGFIDGDFTVTYDGIPFEDTNNPTHHEWAFFPAPDLGGVDFDRSPGMASATGPANYDGTINLLSPTCLQITSTGSRNPMGRGTAISLTASTTQACLGARIRKPTYGSTGITWAPTATKPITISNVLRGAVTFTYKFSDKTHLTLNEDSVILDANKSGNSPFREQLAEFGANYYLDATQFLSDGVTPDGYWYQFYTYHAPTNIGHVGLNKELGHGWKLDTKGYVYDYSNHEHYNNNTANSAILDTFATTYYGTPRIIRRLRATAKAALIR